MKPMEIERTEELCEEIWSLAERGENSLERVTGRSKLPDAPAVLEELVRHGLAVATRGKAVLTAAGSGIAREIVRRHRLAEVLLSQMLSVNEEVAERTACEMEHILPAEVTDSICAWLGHPRRCPHGKPIPSGVCCQALSPEAKPQVARLADLTAGEAGRIVFIAPTSRGSLERLAALGVIPGREIRLVQRRPAVVLDAGCTTIALDPEVACDIYVRRGDES